MCGRYAITDPEEYAERFGLDALPEEIKPRFNAAPGQNLPVIIREDENRLEIMKWGLIPFWSKDIKIGYKMINARAEGVDSKASFRKPFKSQRCLIPANGFYEWQRNGHAKQPYFFCKSDKSAFAFAGLYDVWHSAGEKIKSFTIITTAANNLVKPIHDRMPVILDISTESEWLDPETDSLTLINLLKSKESIDWQSYRVSDLVNSPGNDHASIIEPI